ncbi:hypothetical protein FF1_033409 [Malus domestica]
MSRFRKFAKDNFPSLVPEFLYILSGGISMLGSQVFELVEHCGDHLENKYVSAQLLEYASEEKKIREIMERAKAESKPKVRI